MPIPTGPYCEHCVDADGNLQRFDDRFDKMVAFFLTSKRATDRRQAERDVLAYMSNMPAWRDHPQLRAALGKPSSWAHLADDSV
jgi:hypothetical protein